MYNWSTFERMVFANVLLEELPESIMATMDTIEVLLYHGCIKEAMEVCMNLVYDTPGGMAYDHIDDYALSNIIIWKTVNYRLHMLFVLYEPQIKSFIAIHRKKEVYTILALFCLESVVNGEVEFVGELYEAPGLSDEERNTIWFREVVTD